MKPKRTSEKIRLGDDGELIDNTGNVTNQTPGFDRAGRIFIILMAVLILGGVIFQILTTPGSLDSIIAQLNETPLAQSTANKFMNAVTTGDYKIAYSLLHSSATARFGGNADEMQKLFNNTGMQPSAFSTPIFNPSAFVIEKTSVVSSTGFARGHANLNGINQSIYLNLGKEGDSWKIVDVCLENISITTKQKC